MAGTSFQFIAENTSDDRNDNYDILMSTNTEGALNDGTNDPTAQAYYNRLVPNSNMNFYTGNASGTWTLRLCDRDNNEVNGTFNRARLILGSAAAATASCTSTVTPTTGAPTAILMQISPAPPWAALLLPRPRR